MKFALATLCLNEMEWLPKLYEQHKDWPGLVSWVFVEAADATFAKTNPHLVGTNGLSVDGTTDWLAKLAAEDPRVKHIRFGLSRHNDPALCKIPARQAYLDYLEGVRPDFLLILDADEFYCRRDQLKMESMLSVASPKYRHFCFGFTHIWHPPSLVEQPLFTWEVVGGFWKMPHTKGIRWAPGLRYSASHQRCDNGSIPALMQRFSSPKCLHMAFASSLETRVAKHQYYIDRGEGDADSKRNWYVESRRAFEVYQPGDRLPHGAVVRRYAGPIPEAFA